MNVIHLDLHRLVLTLLMVCLPFASARSEQTVNGLPFADEYVRRSDYFVHQEALQSSWALTLFAVERLIESASQVIEAEREPGDASCPVRFERLRVLPFGPDYSDYEEISEIRIGLRPGVYLYPVSSGSLAQVPGNIAKVAVKPGFTQRHGWILAHELGHNAGLKHEVNSFIAPSPSQIVTSAQCDVLIAAAEPAEKSRCLLYDATLDAQGLPPYLPAPRWTPCSDGSGFCDGKGTCVRTRPQCFTESGPASLGTDCSADGFCGVCNGWSGRCVPCDTPRNRDQSGVCGNGIVEGAEACDDGNLYAGDGCKANCKLSEILPAYREDSDGDGVPDYADHCPLIASLDQSDSDGDGIGDACDRCLGQVQLDPTAPCPGDGDQDGDSVPDSLDNCPGVPTADVADRDGDFVGDACDLCPSWPDTGQRDWGQDGIGDACECGDLNQDGRLSFGDVTCVAYCFLGRTFPTCVCDLPTADTQNDGLLGYDDVSNLVAAILGDVPKDSLTCEARPVPGTP